MNRISTITSQHRFLVAQFGKFIFVGGTAFAIDFGTYYFLTRLGHYPYFLSRVASISLSLIWNFVLNRYWTFKAGGGIITQQIIRYTVVIVGTSLASLGLMKVGVEFLKLPDIPVLVVVSGFLALVNFFLHRFWSFIT